MKENITIVGETWITQQFQIDVIGGGGGGGRLRQCLDVRHFTRMGNTTLLFSYNINCQTKIVKNHLILNMTPENRAEHFRINSRETKVMSNKTEI